MPWWFLALGVNAVVMFPRTVVVAVVGSLNISEPIEPIFKCHAGRAGRRRQAQWLGEVKKGAICLANFISGSIEPICAWFTLAQMV
jgi:hypothetical protein